MWVNFVHIYVVVFSYPPYCFLCIINPKLFFMQHTCVCALERVSDLATLYLAAVPLSSAQILQSAEYMMCLCG